MNVHYRTGVELDDKKKDGKSASREDSRSTLNLGRPSAFSPLETDGIDPVSNILDTIRAISSRLRRRLASAKPSP
jgi:hypothetical protein